MLFTESIERMHEHVKSILERISATLKEKYPGSVLSVTAFGSRVRGDHMEGSDFDVLIVVKKTGPLNWKRE